MIAIPADDWQEEVEFHRNTRVFSQYRPGGLPRNMAMKISDMKISDILIREAIVTDLKATTKEGTFRELVSQRATRRASRRGGPGGARPCLATAEELSRQVVGRGIFCPRGGHPGVDRVVGTIGLSHQGLDFGGSRTKRGISSSSCWGPLIIDGRRIQPGEQHLFYGWHALAPVINTQNVMDRVHMLTREEVFDLIVAADRETISAVIPDPLEPGATSR